MTIITVLLLFIAIVFAILGYINNSAKYNSIAILSIIVELLIGIGIRQQLF